MRNVRKKLHSNVIQKEDKIAAKAGNLTKTERAQKTVDRFKGGLDKINQGADFVNRNFDFNAALGGDFGFGSSSKKKNELISW